MSDIKPDDAPVFLSEDRGSVRILRMNRPAKLNALNTPLTQALHDGLLQADADDSVRAVVLAGEGRAFCAGADVEEFKDLTASNPQMTETRSALTMRTHVNLRHLRKPIVSAVQGSAVGGGAGLAIGCDMMVASTDLKFGFPEIRHSIVPAIVMTTLQRQIGAKKAFEIISLGKLLKADEVLALGLANRIVEPDAVLDAAMEIATAWSVAKPAAMMALKGLFYEVGDLPFVEAMEAGRRTNVQMRAFREDGA